jgi:hypothetical protein
MISLFEKLSKKQNDARVSNRMLTLKIGHVESGEKEPKITAKTKEAKTK